MGNAHLKNLVTNNFIEYNNLHMQYNLLMYYFDFDNYNYVGLEKEV